jgi:hypothetical protein
MQSNRDCSVRRLGGEIVALRSVAATGKDEGMGRIGTGTGTDFHLALG